MSVAGVVFVGLLEQVPINTACGLGERHKVRFLFERPLDVPTEKFSRPIILETVHGLTLVISLVLATLPGPRLCL